MSDERLKKVLGEGRESRSAYDRVATESRELSDDDRVEMFRSSTTARSYAARLPRPSPNAFFSLSSLITRSLV